MRKFTLLDGVVRCDIEPMFHRTDFLIDFVRAQCDASYEPGFTTPICAQKYRGPEGEHRD